MLISFTVILVNVPISGEESSFSTHLYQPLLFYFLLIEASLDTACRVRSGDPESTVGFLFYFFSLKDRNLFFLNFI